MKKLTVQITLAAISAVSALGSIKDFEGEFYTKLMRVGWTRCLSDLDQYSAEEQRIVFENALRAFGGDPPPRGPERQRNFETAQSALLAIPGHAKYYQEKIEQTRALLMHYESLPEEERRKMEEEYRDRNENLGKLTHYDGVRSEAFVILGLLPSPESVAVLGHYLEDPEGRDGKDLLGNPIRGLPNCGIACNALSRLGIYHPPDPATEFADSLQYHERVDVWKQWWQEIKAGKRTYRFIGSNIEYGPDGPATPEQIEKARQTRERDEKRAAGHDRRMGHEGGSEKAFDTKKQSSPLLMLIAAAAVVLVSIVWYLRRNKSAA